MSQEQPDYDQDRVQVPSYYSDAAISDQIGTWFKLSELRSDKIETLQMLEIASTGTPLLSLLGSSRSSMFIVAAKRGAKLA